MTCPMDHYGRPKCQITAHPDHPQQQFCSACGRRFHHTEKWNDIFFLTVAVFTLLLIAINRLPQPSGITREIPTLENAEYIIPR
ncbi:MAG: hypothetical protein P5702_08240 [Limnospira sp. PMC 1291.21]|uniref:Uncharacterized protein n=1 Tax=Limnospira fusiformis PMC 851.14 TaxID=2219512 RepID=A0ABU9EJC6_LIMFS|nr:MULTISPECIES: hypothetical protein [Limnospira]MDY7055399.1 hypothetical protein [Limnospira fusiformis LS22]UWU48785.1 hypothetical protein APLC1_3589 [Arthrospira platensis C1]MDT9177442.1 hypothetical protein [Limnospira sp. PMC 1238.20]MDT9187652.1 hypothetical protein [Limnospira sp. PMC 894.15]MDT9192721.1 hypothetical protein [Limnospira sp. PMC 1245.20]